MPKAFMAAGLLLFALCAVGCSDDIHTTVIDLSDCGLIRSDLLGEWDVTFFGDTATFFNCVNTDPGDLTNYNGDTVNVPAATFTFLSNDIQVFASAANSGFQFNNFSSPVEIMGNIEADSCNMLFSFLDDEDIYLNCIGVFDIPSGVVQGFCDSVGVPSLPVSNPPAFEADCDIDPILPVVLTIF